MNIHYILKGNNSISFSQNILLAACNVFLYKFEFYEFSFNLIFLLKLEHSKSAGQKIFNVELYSHFCIAGFFCYETKAWQNN